MKIDIAYVRMFFFFGVIFMKEIITLKKGEVSPSPALRCGLPSLLGLAAPSPAYCTKR